MKTKDILNQLRAMAGEAGEALFRRVGMVREVLEDREFVGAEFGDWETARDVLHQECFPDLSMAVTLDQLLTLYAFFPNVERWREYKFNLRRLWAQYVEEDKKKKGEKKPGPSGPHRPTKEEWEKQQEMTDSLAFVLKRRDEEKSALERRVGELVAENVDLKNQLALAKKEAADLRRKLDRLERPRPAPARQEASVA